MVVLPGLDVMKTPDRLSPTNDTAFSLRAASLSDLETVLTLVLHYHRHAGIDIPPAQLRKALSSLLGTRRNGRVWLSACGPTIAGYTRLAAFYNTMGFKPRHKYNLLTCNIAHGA